MPSSISRLALALLLALPSASFAAVKGDVLVLAWSMKGDLALVRETHSSPASLGYRIVGPGVPQKHFVISKEARDASGAAIQAVSAEECRAQLIELRDLLRSTRFKGVTLDSAACSGSERAAAVAVSEEQASAAESGELELTSDGQGFERESWRLEVFQTLVAISDGKQLKKLKLPRAIHPSAAHPLLSPTRRLLLILVSQENGDQTLAAGFSSKTGELADFE